MSKGYILFEQNSKWCLVKDKSHFFVFNGGKTSPANCHTLVGNKRIVQRLRQKHGEDYKVIATPREFME